MKQRKIAIISQSSHRGGAESALLNFLYTTVRDLNHNVVAIFPDSNGPLIQDIEKIGAKIEICSMSKMLGDPVNAVLQLSGGSYSDMIRILNLHAVDLVITNTLSIFDGALAAAKIMKPHIWSIHEIVERSPEFMSASIAVGAYAAWINELSDHAIFCSEATKNAYAVTDCLYQAAILAPFKAKELKTPKPKVIAETDEIRLFFIGADTQRKNPEFAIEVLKSLTMRGKKAHLFLVGTEHNWQSRLDFLIRRRGLSDHVTYLGYLTQPYDYIAGLAINLVCAVCEPFGITVVECLSRGIPVVAPNIDGPAGLLDSINTYETGDISACVRIIERIARDYLRASSAAFDTYSNNSSDYDETHQANLIQRSIELALNSHRSKLIPREFSNDLFHAAVFNDQITQNIIINNIVAATDRSHDEIVATLANERAHPGRAVGLNVRQFDVIPFQYTKEMDELYRYGDGFYIELLANIDDPARLKMASFILLRLLTEGRRVGRGLKVLAVGDGIGLDSIRIAAAGFDVDYMDFENSVTSSVAAKNFENFGEAAKMHHGTINVVGMDHVKETVYDAVISLEVIEHVSDPVGFLDFLAQCLKNDGLLFISECFRGVEDIYLTHLSNNERLAGLLPLVAGAKDLLLEGFSKSPMYKPYVFRKIAKEDNILIIKSMVSSSFADIIEREHRAVRSQTLTNISMLAGLIRTFKHYVRRYLRKMRLKID